MDSITVHGKLWLNEDDTRTHLVRQEYQPAWLSDATFGKQAKDMHETLNLLERNLAQWVTHRAASWWMDLAGGGAFSDPAPWAMLRERLQLYDEVLNKPLAFRPEVAVLFDPESKYYGRFLAVHSGTAGLKRIELPVGVSARAMTGRIEKADGSAICVPFAAGDTLWFRLDPASGSRPLGRRHARSTR